MIRTCEKCGCTDHNPCFHPHWGFCWWPSRTEDVCSHCLSKELEEDPETIHCVSGREFPVLSVHQPYALMLVTGKKEFEYRSWKLPAQYVGKRLFIHAAALASMADFDPQFAEEEVFCDHRELAYNNQLGSVIVGSVMFGESQGPIDSVVDGVQKKLYKWPVKDPIILNDPLRGIPGKQRIWKSCFERRITMEEKHVIFIPKDKIHMEPVIPIATWPTETAEEESETPKVFRHKVTFSIKIPKKKQRFFLKKHLFITKFPRKLKKGARHLEYTETGDFFFENKDGAIIYKSPLMHFRIKKGYPHTKWAKKCLRMINTRVVNYLRNEI